MTNKELMNYWIESSDKDYDTMLYMQKGKRNTWTLFMGHLVIEKLLKALYAKNHKNAPYAPKSHDLEYLSDKNGLILTDEQEKIFNEITKFNMSARYDDYKKEFEKKCTDEYTSKQVKNIKEVREWLKNLL